LIASIALTAFAPAAQSPAKRGRNRGLVGKLHHHRNRYRVHRRAHKSPDIRRMVANAFVAGTDRRGDADFDRIRAHSLRLCRKIGNLGSGRAPDGANQLAVAFLDLLQLAFPLFQVQVGIQHGIKHAISVYKQSRRNALLCFQRDRLRNDGARARVDAALDGLAIPRPGPGSRNHWIFEIKSHQIDRIRHCKCPFAQECSGSGKSHNSVFSLSCDQQGLIGVCF
jgi:hypothetical protein